LHRLVETATGISVVFAFMEGMIPARRFAMVVNCQSTEKSRLTGGHGWKVTGGRMAYSDSGADATGALGGVIL
jgi:aldehyde:ferredoxin oxidoreductase